MPTPPADLAIGADIDQEGAAHPTPAEAPTVDRQGNGAKTLSVGCGGLMSAKLNRRQHRSAYPPGDAETLQP